VRVPLRSVANHRNLLRLNQLQIRRVVIEHLSHRCLPHAARAAIRSH
jgi:hypothetical protein